MLMTMKLDPKAKKSVVYPYPSFPKILNCAEEPGP